MHDAGRWQVHRRQGPAADLLAFDPPAPPAPIVRLLEVDATTLVLGSTQPHVGAAPGSRPPIVARRRSGGGAVLVEPGAVLWVDVVVPAGDSLWDADVGRAFWWLGDVWAGALAPWGDAVAHRGALRRSPWSDLVCFAGLGPGEVTIGGRKVVGISQRRTRQAALFQCAALLAWDATATAAAVGVPAAAADLASTASGLDAAAPAVERAFLAGIGSV